MSLLSRIGSATRAATRTPIVRDCHVTARGLCLVRICTCQTRRSEFLAKFVCLAQGAKFLSTWSIAFRLTSPYRRRGHIIGGRSELWEARDHNTDPSSHSIPTKIPVSAFDRFITMDITHRLMLLSRRRKYRTIGDLQRLQPVHTRSCFSSFGVIMCQRMR